MGEHRGQGWVVAERRRQRAAEEIAKIAGIAKIANGKTGVSPFGILVEAGGRV
jgi:hypothetical protein